MKLFILNDNINSFDNVILSLKKNLNYPYSQCVSIATIVHYAGKCVIKSGDSDNDVNVIQTVFKMLSKDGLTVKIEVE
jgi:ATP-dependent Clp protease adapter protein ClpS